MNLMQLENLFFFLKKGNYLEITPFIHFLMFIELKGSEHLLSARKCARSLGSKHEHIPEPQRAHNLVRETEILLTKK